MERTQAGNFRKTRKVFLVSLTKCNLAKISDIDWYDDSSNQPTFLPNTFIKDCCVITIGVVMCLQIMTRLDLAQTCSFRLQFLEAPLKWHCVEMTWMIHYIWGTADRCVGLLTQGRTVLQLLLQNGGSMYSLACRTLGIIPREYCSLHDHGT